VRAHRHPEEPAKPASKDSCASLEPCGGLRPRSFLFFLPLASFREDSFSLSFHWLGFVPGKSMCDRCSIPPSIGFVLPKSLALSSVGAGFKPARITISTYSIVKQPTLRRPLRAARSSRSLFRSSPRRGGERCAMRRGWRWRAALDTIVRILTLRKRTTSVEDASPGAPRRYCSEKTDANSGLEPPDSTRGLNRAPRDSAAPAPPSERF